MICCFENCENDIGKYGNNALPLMNGRCCSECNQTVIMYRLYMAVGQ